jgi:predicted DNA-binding transcriptional regulator YafY
VLSLTASGTPWLFRFLLKFAPDAELLKPAPLRAEFRKMLEELLQNYGERKRPE